MNKRRQLTRRKRSNGRRGRGRKTGQMHILPYYFSTTIPNTTGDYSIKASDIGIMNSRPCRIVSLTLMYNMLINNGGVMSFTIENLVEQNDATTRSPPLLVSTFPRKYTLRNPRSTDFSYIGGDDVVSKITLSCSNKKSASNIQTFLCGTIVLQFSPSQPSTIVEFELNQDNSEPCSNASMLSDCCAE